MEPEVRVKKQLASFYLGWGELSPRQVLGPPILFCSPAPDTLGEIIGSKLIFQVRKLRPGIAPRESSSSQGSPPHPGVQGGGGGEGSHVYPQKTGAGGVWESHVRLAPAVVEEFESSSLVAFSLGKL